jgi:putative heme-binding domain-containing protein
MFRRSYFLLALIGTPVFAGDIVTQRPEPQPSNAPGATAKPEAFNLLPGFQVEKIFNVPRQKFGSWVCLTVDPKGRIIACDQAIHRKGDIDPAREKKGLYRITPPRPGTDELTKVEPLDVEITAAQGLLFAFGHLYVSVNGGPGSGLYRIPYDAAADTFGTVEKLKELKGGGEHGPHALRLAPDGMSILIVCGNHTQPPADFKHSRVPKNWQEDLLLPRQWDAGGHARGVMAPGGYIARTDPDGKTWEIITTGYRNAYDFALNADGEMFAYDSDMEWDMGMPWYRPTRVTHATSGSEFGWRSGTGKWPAYSVDSLPPMIDIGPGSPVGVEFGYGTRFPPKYQKALYILDWTFGTIYAIHIEPDGATYKATKEEFLSRTPLPLTDAVVGADGALYFATGGRNTQSDLWRVTYTGAEPTEPVVCKDTRDAEPRALRRRIEQYHEPAANPAGALTFLYPLLSHPDRFIRYSARVALEHLPVQSWQDRVLDNGYLDGLVGAVVALARQGDKSLQPRLVRALNVRLDSRAIAVDGRRAPAEPLTPTERGMLDLLRAYSLVFIRMGEPDKETTAGIIRRLDRYFPSPSDVVNRELVQLLVYLKSPTVVAKTTELLKRPSKPTPQPTMQDLLTRSRQYGPSIQKMLDNAPDQQKLAYIFALRNVKDGWTMDQRKVYFGAIAEARKWSGGSSYQGFLNNIEKDAFDNATEGDRLAIEALGLRKPFQPPELPKPRGPGKDWTTADVLALEPKLKDRSFYNGQRAYAATRCIVCHRFYGDGGATGPDLTQSAGRFGYKDMAEAILEPSKVISDQYRASVVFTNDGKTLTGKVVSEEKDTITVLIDPENSTKVKEVKRSDVDEIKPSATSLMPNDLLKPLNEEEVLDLMAYLLSRGDPRHPMFREEPKPPDPKRKKGPKKKE